jgi:hypothetical protein
MMVSSDKIRPRIAVLWNGIPLEQLGIAHLLKSADLTMTNGRTNPTPNMPLGKPKLGGANITFVLPDERSAKRILQLLYANPRPFLTMGFGFQGSTSYWLGGAAIQQKQNSKKHGAVRGYKINTVSWRYSSEIPTVILSGAAGRIQNLSEDKRARIWSGKTLAQIAEGVALEGGVTVRISGRLPVNKRIEHVVQAAGESGVDVLQRLAAMSGGVVDVQTMLASQIPGASRAYDYVFEGRSEDESDDHWALDQERVRTIITLKTIEEEFVSVEEYEQGRIPIIAWAPNLSPGKFAASGGATSRNEELQTLYYGVPDYVAASISIDEENVQRSYAQGAGVTASAQKAASKAKPKDPTAQDLAVYVDLETGTLMPAGPLLEASRSSQVSSPSAVSGEAPVVQAQVKPAPSKPTQTVQSTMPEALGGKDLTEAQLRAAVIASGIKSKVTVELHTGAPELPPGMIVQVLGTFTHDDHYGIEESRIVYDAENGLRTSLTCRRLRRDGSGTSPLKAAAQRGVKTPKSPESLKSDIAVGVSLETNTLMSEAIVLEAAPSVPAASSTEALDREIQNGGAP